MKAELPLPAYLVKFIRWHEKLSPKDSFNIDDDQSPIALMLKGAILFNKIPAEYGDYDEMEEKYGGCLIISTVDQRFNFENTVLPRILVSDIVRLLMYFMYECVIEQVNNGIQEGIPIQHTLYRMVDELDIIDDLEWEAFEKSFKRYRSRKKEHPLPSKAVRRLRPSSKSKADLFCVL